METRVWTTSSPHRVHMLEDMEWWRVGGLAAGVLLLAACAGNGPTAVLTDQGAQGGADELLRWERLPVEYCLDLSRQGYADDATFTRLVQRAFEAWGVPSQAEGRCDGEMRQGDAKNEIGWGTPPVPPSNGGGVYEAGYTRLRYRACVRNCHGANFEILEADIVIDQNAPRGFRSETCLYSAILHEVGHLLGLPHLPPPAVMAAVTTACPQAPAQTDRRALDQRYGGSQTPQ